MSGSIVVNFHTVLATELTWLSKSTYAEYNSSAQFFRSFCMQCGSTIAWEDRTVVDNEIELTVGGFDEEFLVGGRDEEDRPLGAYGAGPCWPIRKATNSICGMRYEM